MRARPVARIAAIVALLLLFRNPPPVHSLSCDALALVPRVFLPLVQKPPEAVAVLAANWVDVFGVGEWSTLVTVGEVQNNLPHAITNVRIEGTSISGVSATTYADLDVIGPGETSSFRIDFMYHDTGGFVSCNAQLWTELHVASYDVADAGPVGLEILQETATDLGTSFRVSGLARNSTAETVLLGKALVRLYNRGGELIGREVAYLNPASLGPGQAGQFQVTLYDWGDCPGGDHAIDHYRLNVVN